MHIHTIDLQSAEAFHLALCPRAPAFVRTPALAGPMASALPSRSEQLRRQIAEAQALRTSVMGRG